MIPDLQTIQWLLPEILLVVVATGIYVAGAFYRNHGAWTFLAAASYVAAAAVLALAEGGPSPPISGPLTIDVLGYHMRWLTLLSGFLFTLLAGRTGNQQLGSEQLGTLMLVVVGVMLVARANELVFLFLGLELVSIPTYVLLFLGRRDRASGEATAKYFFLSILSSALLLYGLSFLYGLAGTTLISGGTGTASIQQALSAEASGAPGLGAIALVLIFAGLGFKIAAVPFHFYAPDVYQGTTNANAGVLAVAPKIAGIVALTRLTVVAMPGHAAFAWQVAMVLAILTMTIGNVCALWQRNLRRLLAYSSIAHAGYMLIGISVALAAPQGSVAYGGVAATVFYLLVYVFASFGTFAALTYLGSQDQQVSDIDELAGLGKRQPLAAGAIAVFMFSLAGIPPLAGFWGKLTLLTSAVSLAQVPGDAHLQTWFAVLAVAGALNAAIAAAYYLRVVSALYFRPALLTPPPADGGYGALAAMAMCALLTVLIGVQPGQLLENAGRAESSLRPSVTRVTTPPETAAR